MSGYSGQQKEAADLAACLVRTSPLSRINESIAHASKRAEALEPCVLFLLAAALCPAVENLLKEKYQGLPELIIDPEVGKYFIATPFNKLKASFRSPWTDAWLPPIPEAAKPAPHLRQLEAQFNAAYDAYRDAHYGSGVSSVYVWPLQNHDGFAAAFLLLKEVAVDEAVRPLCFFSHRLEVTLTATNAHYRASSHLLLLVPCEGDASLKGGVSTLLSRSVEQTQKVQDARAAATAGSGAPMGPQHLAVGGPLIERNEAALLDAAGETRACCSEAAAAAGAADYPRLTFFARAKPDENLGDKRAWRATTCARDFLCGGVGPCGCAVPLPRTRTEKIL
ncbi:F-actin-capping protein subunit beta [Cyclospora cayetanensis]|uniref:F-actin-capping protein subunit beta n=1 Tax=Cyclospora cayetanensis TaxID=88456 RepID=A0A6P6RXN6_9EIME|nr:F-actin-capping protein subunit beta [Cyclospora cayetanensis]